MEMTVSKERFQKISKVIENFDGEEISFSFLIGSLFPDAWKNIQQALKDEHMRGYLEAKEEED
jgi:hypothetical protein